MSWPPSFIYTSSPSRVIFGQGSIQKLPSELSRLSLHSPLILSTIHQIDQAALIKTILDGKVSGIFDGAVMHTPVEVTEKALKYALEIKADSIISIGGGSTIGLGKAISIRTGLPHICIPTTYAGSEMTPILGETENGIKITRSDSKILTCTVIYDVDLTMTLPAQMSATSGVNAIAHAVEALYAQNANPIISLLSLEGIGALVKALPVLAEQPKDLQARLGAQYGAWLCGLALGAVGMSLHHKLCHTIGGSFNMPHAETHTIILPHALAYNAPEIPKVMEKLARVLPGSEGDAVKGLNVLLTKLGVKKDLMSFGFNEEDVDRAADIAVQKEYGNPRKVERDLIREVVRRAWAGEDARADL